MSIFTDKDFDFVIEAVVEAAAAEIRPRFRTLSALQVIQKSSTTDLVTEADFRTEKRLSARLSQRFPHALVIGEESYEQDRTVVPALRHAKLAFVIDPVDGTYNFASGLPVFGTILAIVANGETIAGLIHDCLNGDHILAVRGAGAHLRRRDGLSTLIGVAPAVSLGEMVGSVGFAFMDEPERSFVAGRMARIRMPITLNCSAYEYWLACVGRMHFLAHRRASPWDHLAGVLIHREAGGYGARLDGSPYRPGDVEGGILCAPDLESWTIIRNEIFAIA